MVVVMAPEATQEDVNAIVDLVRTAGGDAFVSRGVSRTIVGLVGDVDEFGSLNLRSRSGVLDVVRISVPYKLISREHHPDRSVIKVGGVPIGPDTLTVIAGPCAVETPEQTLTAARMAKAAGASLLRGGAFKPRTSPYAYQGLGEAGLKILADVRAETGLPVVTEVIDPASVELVSSYADMLQVGTRNMQNFALLQAVGSAAKPVLLKRGMSATIEEWLMAAEYIAQRGNLDIVLCERGIRTFETATRNTLDISAVPVAQRLSHLPVIVDPSHSGGRRDLVLPLTRAAIAVGADGVIIDVHPEPKMALCDGDQALVESDIREIASIAVHLSPLMGRTLTPAQAAGAGAPAQPRRLSLRSGTVGAVLLREAGQLLGQVRRLQPGLDPAQVVDPRPGLHMPRRQQGAAVLVGQLGQGERADAARLRHDLQLVAADQRAQDGQPDRVVERGEVGQRLAAHLPQRVAGHQRGRPQPAGQHLAGLEHEPALGDDLQPARARGRQPLLCLAERHHEQPGPALVAVQLVHQPVGLVHRLGPGQRHAGEVQEIAAQAAAHHPVGGDR
jgi:3-deoxy-7-phosphoheptulonate synthase